MTLSTFAQIRKMDNAREVNWGWTGGDLARGGGAAWSGRGLGLSTVRPGELLIGAGWQQW